MSHEVAFAVAADDRLAFTQACVYPDGTPVFCIAAIELREGLILRQTVVQAWDE